MVLVQFPGIIHYSTSGAPNSKVFGPSQHYSLVHTVLILREGEMDGNHEIPSSLLPGAHLIVASNVTGNFDVQTTCPPHQPIPRLRMHSNNEAPEAPSRPPPPSPPSEDTSPSRVMILVTA